MKYLLQKILFSIKLKRHAHFDSVVMLLKKYMYYLDYYARGIQKRGRCGEGKFDEWLDYKVFWSFLRVHFGHSIPLRAPWLFRFKRLMKGAMTKTNVSKQRNKSKYRCIVVAFVIL